MRHNINVTETDIATARHARRALQAVMSLPLGPLEHLVQTAHESGEGRRHEPREPFLSQGVNRQVLRMLWHFRNNLESAMPRETRG